MRQKETILENKINSCRLLCSMVVLDQATGSSYMLVAYLSYWIHLPFSLHKLCALYICKSVLSCHPKTNALQDTSLRLLLYLTPSSIGGMFYPLRLTQAQHTKKLIQRLFCFPQAHGSLPEMETSAICPSRGLDSPHFTNL